MAGTMKSLLVLVAILGLAAGFSVGGASTTERDVRKNRDRENDVTHDQNGLIEVSEDQIPEGAVVYVLDELAVPRVEGESLEPADNIVFRPLFQYRNRQEAQQRRRVANGYRRRYFIQRRPYRDVYRQYHPQRWT